MTIPQAPRPNHNHSVKKKRRQRGLGRVFFERGHWRQRVRFCGAEKEVILDAVTEKDALKEAKEKSILLRAELIRSKNLHPTNKSSKKLLASALTPLESAWNFFDNPHTNKGAQKQTMRQYKCQYDRFLAWASERKPIIRFVEEVTPAIANNFMDSLIDHKRSNGTYNKYLDLLARIWNIMIRKRGLEIINPWERCDRLQLDDYTGRENFDLETITMVVSRATGELRTLLLIGYYTGLRLGKCCRLKWDQIDFNTSVIRIPAVRKNSTKKTPPELPLAGNLKVALELIQSSASTEYVCPTFAALYDKHESYATAVIQKHLTTCGIQTKYPKDAGSPRSRVRFGFHSIRHTVCTALNKGGASESTVGKVVGHGNPQTTKLYIHTDVEELRKTMGLLPELKLEADKHSLPVTE